MSRPPERDAFLEHFLPGSNPAMHRLRDTIGKVNRKYKTPPRMGRAVLLLGETGVGKNHVARVLAGHLCWLRDPGIWHQPTTGSRLRTLREITAEHFAEVAMPNLPAELIESELFGHIKGAFTGAVADKDGYFGADYIDDLLLDEIGEAPLALQAKLLQVLSDGSFKRLGSPPREARFTEARVLLATNRDLAALVRSGQFRADLYWRVQQLVVRIPPLREQRDRIPVLAEAIVADTLHAHGASARDLKLREEDLAWAKKQPWPGNVREFERLLWRWVYEEGRPTLEEIQREYPEENLDQQGDGNSVKALVHGRLKAAIEKGERLAETVGDFARDIEREVQAGLYELKSEMGLDRRALDTLFGDGPRAAKQISAWGERLRSS